MSSDNLVKMANQIAHYFDSEPDRSLAVQGVRNHLKSFWAPSMLKKIRETIDGPGGGEVDGLVKEALK